MSAKTIDSPQFFSSIHVPQTWSLVELKRLTPAPPLDQSLQETCINAAIFEALSTRKRGVNEYVILFRARESLRSNKLAGLLTDSDIDEITMKQLVAMETAKIIFEVQVANPYSPSPNISEGWRLRADLRAGVRLFTDWVKNG